MPRDISKRAEKHLLVLYILGCKPVLLLQAISFEAIKNNNTVIKHSTESHFTCLAADYYCFKDCQIFNTSLLASK